MYEKLTMSFALVVVRAVLFQLLCDHLERSMRAGGYTRIQNIIVKLLCWRVLDIVLAEVQCKQGSY